MQILVAANETQKKELLEKGVPDDVQVSFMKGEQTPDAYFDLLFEEKGAQFADVSDKPVFVNAVVATCSELPANYIRINAWDGFLKREIVEFAAADSQVEKADTVFKKLGWKAQLVADIPGMIAARVVAMVINEAYFGLGDGISSKKDIDTAMKLGTNYPYGPFEWSEKIGLHKIYLLLAKLSATDSRYTVAPALEKELPQ